jgi:hypothetical protein
MGPLSAKDHQVLRPYLIVTFIAVLVNGYLFRSFGRSSGGRSGTHASDIDSQRPWISVLYLASWIALRKSLSSPADIQQVSTGEQANDVLLRQAQKWR